MPGTANRCATAAAPSLPATGPHRQAHAGPFPELNVTGWVVLHSPDGNLHEPVIDHYGKSRSGGGVEIVNGAGLARGLKQFLSSGPAPNTVVVPVLARLLRGMH